MHFDGMAIRDVVVNGQGDDIARLEPLLVGGIYPAHNEDRILVSLDQVPSALIGASRVSQIEENVAALSFDDLSAEECQEIDQVLG